VPDHGLGAVFARQPARRIWLRQSQQPGLANEVGLGRSNGRNVQLVAPNHGQAMPIGPPSPVLETSRSVTRSSRFAALMAFLRQTVMPADSS